MDRTKRIAGGNRRRSRLISVSISASLARPFRRERRASDSRPHPARHHRRGTGISWTESLGTLLHRPRRPRRAREKRLAHRGDACARDRGAVGLGDAAGSMMSITLRIDYLDIDGAVVSNTPKHPKRPRDLVRLVEAAEAKPAKRGPYRKKDA
jgi:hypothetical protein